MIKFLKNNISNNTNNTNNKNNRNNNRKNTFIYWYSVLLTIFTCAFIWRVCFYPIGEENLRFVDTILGFLMGSIFSNVVAYHFGSSDPDTILPYVVKDQTNAQKEKIEDKLSDNILSKTTKDNPNDKIE